MLNRVFEFFASFKQGSINLPSGVSEIEIPTGKQPKEVWLRKVDTNGMTVCGADHDWFDYELTENSFVLSSQIKSESINVEWFVWF